MEMDIDIYHDRLSGTMLKMYGGVDDIGLT